MLRVTPIYGSRYSNKGQAEEPECTLVEYGGCRVLWNVGWWLSAQQSSSSEEDPFPDLPEHDCLILTDSTLQSAGGLPLYYKAMQKKRKRKLQQQGAETEAEDDPPIYATFPTVKMGQMTLYDQHANLCLDGVRPPFTLEDLDSVCGAIKSIKYSQTVTVRHPTTNQPSLSITAYRAGHVVGGAFFVLQRLQDETVVVLTSRYHIAKELHLDSSTLLKYGSTPDVLVTHPGGPAFRQMKALAHGPQPALPQQLVTQKERALLEFALSVLRREGNILFPVDAAGRVLELILFLDQQWGRQRLSGSYNLCWLGPMVGNTAEFVRCQLEWMSVNMGRQFDSVAGHPFKLNNVKLCATMRELEAVMEASQNNPTCVVASGLSLEGGPARDLLLKWADNPDNAICFTDSSQCFLRKKTKLTTKVMSNSGSGEMSVATEATTTVHPSTAAVSTRNSKTAEELVGTAAVATTLGQAPEIEKGAESSAVDVIPEEPNVGSALAETATSDWTTAGQLLSAWTKAQASGEEMDDSIMIDVKVPHRSPLAGAELKSFLANEEAARQKQLEEEEKQAMLREVELAKGQLRLGEEEATATTGTSSQSETKTLATSSTGQGSISTRPRKKSRFDSSLFLKFSKPLHLTFEVREEAIGIGQSDSTSKYGIGELIGRSGEVLEDDYGIAVLPERFTDIVSGVDPSKFAGGSGRIGDEVLRRGFGYGVDSSKKGSVARVSEDENEDETDEMDEIALEALDLSEGNGIIRGRNGRPPIKVTTFPRKLEVLAEISCIPLEGRVDARAARQSVRALQPRQVVVLGGVSTMSGDNDGGGEVKDSLVDEVSLLAKAAQSFATGSKDVPTPSDGETVELAVGHAAYAVRLIDTPFQTQEKKEASESPPEPIEPFESKLGVCTVSVLDLVATGQKVALDGSLVLAPRQVSSEDTPNIHLSDGDVLLTDLRAELIAQGMKAEYSAHAGYSQLVANGKIVVKKDQDTGKMEIEGPLCEDFYTVRSVLCSQYVTL